MEPYIAKHGVKKENTLEAKKVPQPCCGTLKMNLCLKELEASYI
jgi:hypothetical protein